MRRAILVGTAVVLIVGCAGRKSSLLLERPALGPLGEEAGVAQQSLWVLDPVTQTLSKEGVDVTVTYYSHADLLRFFSDKRIFGAYAGFNPFFPENIVFYIKLTNNTGDRIKIDPKDFVVLDDRKNQYQPLSSDYITALAEYHGAFATFTRGVLEEARPGYFGVGLPVGKILGKPQRRIALLKGSSLEPGYLYNGVVYDGLVAYWSPHEDVHQIKLLLSGIKTKFDANDVPRETVAFSFDFAAHRSR